MFIRDRVYIYVCDVKQDLSHWSKNAVTFFGLPGEYMENAAELWMAKIHPDDRGRYRKDIQDVYKRQGLGKHLADDPAADGQNFTGVFQQPDHLPDIRIRLPAQQRFAADHAVIVID